MQKLIVGLVASLTFVTSAFAVVGDLSKDLVYVPITPCRIADSRIAPNNQASQSPVLAANVPLTANASRSYWGWAAEFSSQGGAANDCGILLSSDVAALAVNFTVISPAAPGYITAYPFGVDKPLAATVNFNAGEVKGNFSIMKISQSGAAFDFAVYTTTSTHLVMDVVGYYSKPH